MEDTTMVNEELFRRYLATHPWLTFTLDLQNAGHRLWFLLGEACSKCDHIAGVPLKPALAKELHQVYLTKGVQATVAIEGNTLTQDQVRKKIDGTLDLPPSREYQGQEVANIIEAINTIYKAVTAGGDATITAAEIIEFNRVVLQKLELPDEVVPGAVRQHAVGVAHYEGAPARDCLHLLERTAEWLNSETFVLPGCDLIATGLLKAVMAHLYIAWIHPFGDGNGRTARLIEFKLLLASGVPSPAAHLLSNHYNLTRSEYYRHLDDARRPDGLLKFVEYALQGFVDGLREQLSSARAQQMNLAWLDYVRECIDAARVGSREELKRRQRDLVLALTDAESPVLPSKIRTIDGHIEAAYAGKTGRAISRDLNALVKMGLLARDSTGYRARREVIEAFLPIRRDDPGA
jgi:Fic family protein